MSQEKSASNYLLGEVTGLIPLKLPNNTEVYVEAAGISIDRLEQLKQMQPPFDEVVSTIEAISQSIIGIWEKVKPSKASTEFGIKLEVKSGKLLALFANGTATAHLTIRLEWSGGST